MNFFFGLSRELYNDLIDIFKKYPHVKKVLIFGSRAKGTEKPSSNFDLAIMGPEMSEIEFNRLWVEVNELPIIFKLDIIHWDTLSNERLKEKILIEGKKFYPLSF